MSISSKAVAQEAIPEALKDKPNWVLWKYEERKGKSSKVLYQCNGIRAKSNTPETWTTFDEVCQAFENTDYIGIGFVINQPHFGVDLDSCIRTDVPRA